MAKGERRVEQTLKIQQQEETGPEGPPRLQARAEVIVLVWKPHGTRARRKKKTKKKTPQKNAFQYLFLQSSDKLRAALLRSN